MGSVDPEDNFEHHPDVSSDGGGYRRSNGLLETGWQGHIHDGSDAKRIQVLTAFFSWYYFY